MGIAISLILIAVGLVLALAVHPANPGSVDPNTVGWILFVVGLLGLILDFLLLESWGPGYLRRRRAVYDDGYARPAAPRRRVVEDEVVDDGPAGPPPP